MTLLAGPEFAIDATSMPGNNPGFACFPQNQSAWVDLPVYTPAWALIDHWLDQTQAKPEPENNVRPDLSWRIAADTGCGKSLFCSEIKHRYHHRRLRLFHVSFRPKITVTSTDLLEKWVATVSRFVDLPEEARKDNKILYWLKLAKESLTYHGYCVRFLVEADRLELGAVQVAYSLGALFLQRKEFRGISSESCPVLPPWTESEIAEVVRKLGQARSLTDQQVESLWNRSRGYPLEVINELNRILG